MTNAPAARPEDARAESGVAALPNVGHYNSALACPTCRSQRAYVAFGTKLARLPQAALLRVANTGTTQRHSENGGDSAWIHRFALRVPSDNAAAMPTYDGSFGSRALAKLPPLPATATS